MVVDDVVKGDGESGWDLDQSALVGAILNAAQKRGVSKRRFRRNSRPIAVEHAKGSDLDWFVPVLQARTYLQAGRLAISVAEEVRMRCGGVQDLAVLLKRSMPLLSLAGAIRVRNLW